MSRQRDELARIVPELCRMYPGCGVLVFGSVGRGDERLDSDLDVMVVYQGDGDLKWDPGARIAEANLKVDLAIFPEAALRKLSQTRWFVLWEFSQAEIVHDPTGVAERCQAVVRQRMGEHPEVARVWGELMVAVRRSKKETGVSMPYGGRPGVEEYLEKLLSSEADPKRRPE